MAGLSTLQQLVAGGIAGAISKTITSPLDVVKVIMQCQRGPEKKYDGVLDAFSKIVAERGFLGFWKGNGVAIIRIAPYSAVKFAAFERLRPVFTGADGRMTNVSRLLAGSLAGIMAVTATYPLDVVKTRVAVQDPKHPKYTGTFQALYRIAQEEGIRSWYVGYPTTILGAIPYEGGSFMAHEWIHSTWRQHMSRPMNTVEKLLAGCLAGAFAQTISYPIDTVRKAMQTAAPGTYSGLADCAVKIVRAEGPQGMFKGMTMNLIKVVPYSALSYYVVGQIRTMMARYNQAKASQKGDCQRRK